MKNRFSILPKAGDFQFEPLKLRLYRLFIGNLIRRGRKLWSERMFAIIYNEIKQTYSTPPEQVFSVVFERLRPHLGVRPKKVGGIVYKLPFLLSSYRQNSLSIKWLIEAARMRKGGLFSRKLIAEINEVYKGRLTSSVKKKNELHRVAIINRVFLR